MSDNNVARLLLELFFTYAFAHWQARQAADGRTVRDAFVYRALKQMHQQVGYGWTVTELARASGLSRKIFLGRFKRATGRTPLKYLARLRMDRAKELLRTTRQPLRQIALGGWLRGCVCVLQGVQAHRDMQPKKVSQDGGP